MTAQQPVLDDVPCGKEFWTCSGMILHNLRDVVNYLSGCPERDYRYHVNTDRGKNDFAVWIREVIHDESLARRLPNWLSRERYLARIKAHITRLLRHERTAQMRRFAA